MSSDESSLWDSDKAQIPADIRSRIVKLASCYSIFEISKLRGMPDASVIYRELGADSGFARAFKRASGEHWRKLRDEFADQVARVNQADPTSVFVELKRLRRLRSKEPANNYVLALLTKGELDQLHALLTKATPLHLRPND